MVMKLNRKKINKHMKKNVNVDISVIFGGKKYVFFETFNGKPDGKSNPKTWI